MIEVTRVHKTYGELVAVRDVTFSLHSGNAVGLLGLNGAGKTTLLSMLAAITPPTTGTISICGYQLPRERRAAQNNIGFMPDMPPLYPDMRVREYLYHMGRLRGLAKIECRLAIESVLERCNLTEVHQSLCGTLSRGYSQRVSLAQALIHDPSVLILDEPTSGLDPEQTLELRSMLRQLTRNKVLLFSSHILTEVEAVCSQVLIMHQGQIEQTIVLNDLEGRETLEARFLQVISNSRTAAEGRVAA